VKSDAWRHLQDGQLLSFGRPTYGGLGRAAVDTQSDNAEPQPQRVDGLDGVSVTAAAAGGF
jgi:Regulator of chromosome condensation (RCC1) repeat